VAEVRDEVDGDVAAVTGDGGGLDLAPCDPLLEVLGDGDVGGCGDAGADAAGDGVDVG